MKSKLISMSFRYLHNLTATYSSSLGTQLVYCSLMYRLAIKLVYSLSKNFLGDYYMQDSMPNSGNVSMNKSNMTFFFMEYVSKREQVLTSNYLNI